MTSKTTQLKIRIIFYKLQMTPYPLEVSGGGVALFLFVLISVRFLSDLIIHFNLSVF